MCVLNCYDSTIPTFCEQSWSKTIWSQAIANLKTTSIIPASPIWYCGNLGRVMLTGQAFQWGSLYWMGRYQNRQLCSSADSNIGPQTCFWTSGCQALFGCTFWWNLVIVAWMGGNLPRRSKIQMGWSAKDVEPPCFNGWIFSITSSLQRHWNEGWSG